MSNEIHKVYRGTVIDVDLEEVELPNGVHAELEIVRHPGGAAVVALDDRDNVCLLRHYRYVMGGWLWELPAGKIDPPEDHRVTAARELREETGLSAHQWVSLGRMLSSPGVFSEVVDLYLARGLEAADHAREDQEVMEVHWLPLAEALERAARGDISDAKTVVGLFRARQYRVSSSAG